MKIRHAKNIPAMHLNTGDSIELRYEEHDEKTGRKVYEKTLHHEQLERPLKVTRLAVVDFEDGEELKLLGMRTMPSASQ